MDWILQNKQWLFSGIGVFFISLFGYFFKKQTGIKQSQKSGDNSTNLQVGGNLSIQNSKSHDK